ncbi:MAG: hypothetical protein WDN10_01235 [bacterium]
MRSVVHAFSLVQWLGGVVAVLVVAYIALIAFVMSYAAVQTETAQSVRDGSAQVSLLEIRYLEKTAALGAMDPASLGYSAPLAKNFVEGPARAAINTGRR